MTLTVGHLLLLFPVFGEEGILWYQIAPFKILKESGRNIIWMEQIAHGIEFHQPRASTIMVPVTGQ